MSSGFPLENLPHHGCVTKITEIIVNIVADKIEKRGELGIADFFWFGSFSLQ